MCEAVNIFPEPHLNEQMQKIFDEARRKHERLQIAFTDHHARILEETMLDVVNVLDTSNPLRRGDNQSIFI